MFFQTIRCRNLLPSLPVGLALQNHLAVFELADEVEIAALIVDPCLLP